MLPVCLRPQDEQLAYLTQVWQKQLGLLVFKGAAELMGRHGRGLAAPGQPSGPAPGKAGKNRREGRQLPRRTATSTWRRAVAVAVGSLCHRACGQ